MEKTVWQLPFHPRLPSRAKAFQCFLGGLRAERADYIQKNESARLIFWRGLGKEKRPRSPPGRGLAGACAKGASSPAGFGRVARLLDEVEQVSELLLLRAQVVDGGVGRLDF